MLEDIGVKQITHKNLKVSKHANIIINQSDSEPSDLIFLIEMIKNKFMNNYGINLSLEVEII